jgi:protein-tyrosine phosphatase
VNCEIGFIDDFRIIDVRTLVDEDNSLSQYMLNIRVTSYLEVGEKVVICCRVGVFRSNAIALGALVYYFKMDFHKAMELYCLTKLRIVVIVIVHYVFSLGL